MPKFIKLTTSQCIERAKVVHGDKYDYSLVEYSKTKIKILCKDHRVFFQIPSDHISSKAGCPKCALLSRTNKRTHTLQQFIDNAKVIHGDKYDYSLVEYKNTHTKVKIICKFHGIFEQTPVAHVSIKTKCPLCFPKHSELALDWINYVQLVDKNHIQHALNGGEYKIPGTRYTVDGYCPATNTIYEFHGDYWHGNPKVFDESFINDKVGKSMGDLYKQTLKKEKVIKSHNNNYNLVIMWEFDWKILKTLEN